MVLILSKFNTFVFNTGNDQANSRQRNKHLGINMGNIYIKTVMHFGIQSQKVKAIEEMAELTQALCKDTNIAEEIADVQILLEQLKIVYPEWKEFENKKLQRLESIILK